MAMHDFVSLNTCLRNGHSEAALATAIETVGVYTWDRFGRFRLFKEPTPQATAALDVLARIYAASESPNDDDEPDYDDPDSFLSLCGWPEQKLPTFVEDVQTPQKPRRKAAIAKEEGSDLGVIGALLLTTGLVHGFKPREKFQSEAQLNSWIRDNLEHVPGLSKRNLETKFAAAKLLIKPHLPQR